MKVKVIELKEESIIFENGYELHSDHDQDCCEHHWLSLDDLSLKDFEGALFDLQYDVFFKRIEGYGIELIPCNWGISPIKIPGYGYNNGYYSSDLTLVLTKDNNVIMNFDITSCQDIND